MLYTIDWLLIHVTWTHAVRKCTSRFFSLCPHCVASSRVEKKRKMQVHFPMKLLASLYSLSLSLFFSSFLSSCFCMTRKTLLAFTLLGALSRGDKLSQVSRCLFNVYCCLKRWRKKASNWMDTCTRTEREGERETVSHSKIKCSQMEYKCKLLKLKVSHFMGNSCVTVYLCITVRLLQVYSETRFILCVSVGDAASTGQAKKLWSSRYVFLPECVSLFSTSVVKCEMQLMYSWQKVESVYPLDKWHWQLCVSSSSSLPPPRYFASCHQFVFLSAFSFLWCDAMWLPAYEFTSFSLTVHCLWTLRANVFLAYTELNNLTYRSTGRK